MKLFVEQTKIVQFIDFCAVGGALVIWIEITIIKTAYQVKVRSSDTTLSFSKSILTTFLVVWVYPQAIIVGALRLGAFRSTLSINEAFLFIFGVFTDSCTLVFYNYYCRKYTETQNFK